MEKQKRFTLITTPISIFIIVLTCTISISLFSCVNNNLPSENGYFYVERLDSTFFINYNSIILSNNRKEKVWLLTEKLLNKETIYNSIEKYQKLKENSVVKLDLVKNDTLKCLKSTYNVRGRGRFVYDIDDKTTVWKDDTIKYNVFFSPQLLDIYIINQN